MDKTYARKISSLDITEQGMLVYDNVGDEYVEVDEDGNPYPVSYLAKTMSREEARGFYQAWKKQKDEADQICEE